MHTERVETLTVIHNRASGTDVYGVAVTLYLAASALDSCCPCNPLLMANEEA